MRRSRETQAELLAAIIPGMQGLPCEDGSLLFETQVRDEFVMMYAPTGELRRVRKVTTISPVEEDARQAPPVETLARVARAQVEALARAPVDTVARVARAPVDTLVRASVVSSQTPGGVSVARVVTFGGRTPTGDEVGSPERWLVFSPGGVGPGSAVAHPRHRETEAELLAAIVPGSLGVRYKDGTLLFPTEMAGVYVMKGVDGGLRRVRKECSKAAGVSE